MKSEISFDERLNYLKYRMSSSDTPMSEKMKIVSFFIHHTGLFGKKLNPTIFMKELTQLTAKIKPKEKR